MLNDDQTRAIADIETGLGIDDPELARRFSRTARRNATVEIVTYALLAVGAVILVTGLGTNILGLIVAGVVPMFCAVALYAYWQRTLRRDP